MAGKKSKEKDAVTVYQNPDESQDAAMARAFMKPETAASITIQKWQGAVLDVDEISKELQQQIDKLKAGDMHRAESMLLAQAHTLDELFNNMARKAHQQEYLSNFESFLKLSLKAQNQCRMTLESLSNIKNPPVVYAKQANISHGPQQVNNGVPTTRTNENQNAQSKLLEHTHGERLDTRTASETVGSDQAMAAMG